MIRRKPLPHVRRKKEHLIPLHRTISLGHDQFSQTSAIDDSDDTPAFCNSLYDAEIRRVICSTNAIESLNARYRRAIRARGHFPNEQAALKCLYLATRALDPTGKGRARWTSRWKGALNAFAITFEGRITPNAN
ncbi:transposase [Rhodococcus ruber]|uniref:transposase n=1 Tax=Rhodococcus ruber TaxID=1830 RepID=UPI00345B6C0C